MKIFKNIATSAILAGGLLAATPSAATVTTFASFNATSNGNIVFKNAGTGGNSSTYRSNGVGGSLFTTNSVGTPDAAVPGTIAVKFSFLSPLNAALTSQVTNVNALLTFNASTTAPATSLAGYTIQPGLTGSFTIKTPVGMANDIMVGSTVYAGGSNLLSATFFNLGGIAGQNGSTSGGASSSTTAGSTVTFTSDFLSFLPTNDRDFSLSLSAITSLVSSVNKGLNFAPAKGLRSFRATATGSFSADPAPLVLNVPEPAVWGMMIAGFGVVGFQSRRRRGIKSVTA